MNECRRCENKEAVKERLEVRCPKRVKERVDWLGIKQVSVVKESKWKDLGVEEGVTIQEDNWQEEGRRLFQCFGNSRRDKLTLGRRQAHARISLYPDFSLTGTCA